MDNWLILAVILYFACAILIIAEVFVPSGGLISILALACAAGGVFICFNQSVFAGWIGAIVAFIMIPTVLIIAYKVLPKTKFGKNVTLSPPDRQQGDAVPDTHKLKEMLGSVGIVMTPLRPVGMCDFSGQRVECVAESGYVDKGKKVKVINVESTQLTVRLIEENS